jgi:hypothetical protein
MGNKCVAEEHCAYCCGVCGDCCSCPTRDEQNNKEKTMKVERIPQTPPPPPDLVVITLSIEEAKNLARFLGYARPGDGSVTSDLYSRLRSKVGE